MRYHFWQFLLNQEGQPINNARISVFIAGTTTPVSIYTGELTSDVVSIAPQIITTSNGYFEFWLGDEAEPSGYIRGTKFKIQWEREGIASGIVDNIEVFQTMDGVNENDPDSIYKNKLLSNALAYKFNTHSEHDVLVDGFPVHGLMMVDPTSNENVFNRVISNRLAYEWENHRNYEFENISPTVLENSAHGLQPVQINSNDSVFNKLISNEIVSDIYTKLLEVRSGTVVMTFAASAWTEDGGEFFYDIEHNLDEEYPFITCWEYDNDEVFYPTKIKMIDSNTVKVTNSVAKNSMIRISKN